MVRIGGLCYINYVCTLKVVGQVNELYNHYTKEITIERVKVNHNLIVFLSFLSYRSNANIKVRFPTCLVLLNETGAFVIPAESLNSSDMTDQVVELVKLQLFVRASTFLLHFFLYIKAGR